MSQLIKISILDEFVTNLTKEFGLVLNHDTGSVSPDYTCIPPRINTDSLESTKPQYFFEITCYDDSLVVVHTLIKKIKNFINSFLPYLYKNSTLVWRKKPEISRYYDFNKEKVVYLGYTRLLVLKHKETDYKNRFIER